MRRSFRFAWSAILVLFLASPLGADQTGDIRGVVIDATGSALPGVVVTARSPSLQGQRSAVSDARGTFRFPLLPVGTYTLTFGLQGFEPLTMSGSDVRLGATTGVAVTLKFAAMNEVVTVTAENAMVDATRTDTSYRLRGAELARVPAQGRTIAEVVGFTPGVTGVRMDTASGKDSGQPSFRGEGDAGNNWLVDGLSTRGVRYGDAGARINYDAWEEVQVVSDGLSPELGHAMGGFVNVVTKSGGNAFHGEAGALLRDRELRARRQGQLSAASLPETSIGQYFGNVGGPILRDRLWFFLSDNYFSTSDRTSAQSVEWLEIPAGERTMTSNNAFGKLTWTPRENHTLSVSGTLDRSLNLSGGIGVPETYADSSFDNAVWRLNYSGIYGRDFFVTGAAGHFRRDSSSVPLSGEYGPPAYFWQDIGQQTNNVPYALSESEQRTDFSVSGSFTSDTDRWGSHEIRAGANGFSNSYENRYDWTGRNLDPWPGNGFDDGSVLWWLAPGAPLTLMESRTGLALDSTRGVGLHVQDTVTWKRLTLMLGLRSDTQEVLNDVKTLLWSWNLEDFLQPRLSLAVDLTGDGRTVLKAGYGHFAMPIATNVLAFYNEVWDFATRLYQWVGPANPTEAQLRDPENWEFLFEQSPSGSPAAIDQELKPNKQQRVLVALERQLAPGWAARLRGVYSRADSLVEDVGVYVPGTPSTFGFLLTNFDEKRRDYRALEVELNGRVGARLFLDSSYTWSRARGTVPGNRNEAGTWNAEPGGLYDGGPFGDHPNVPPDDPNKELIDSLFGGLGGPGVGEEGWYGDLPYSVDHVVKVLATWVGPWGLRISPSLEWLSGYHWEKKGWSVGYGGFYKFPEGRGGRTTPSHAYFDLAVEKAFRLGKGLTLDLGVNVYNLFNSQQAVSYVKEDTELFGQVWARQLPLWVQVKAAVRF